MTENYTPCEPVEGTASERTRLEGCGEATKRVLHAAFGPLDTWGGGYETIRRVDRAVWRVRSNAFLCGLLIGSALYSLPTVIGFVAVLVPSSHVDLDREMCLVEQHKDCAIHE